MESAAENPLNASDPAELLELCASLHDSSGTEIQKKINIYLQNQTGASAVFVVSILHKTEGVIQVIGNTVLEHELRFPVVNDVLNLAVKRRASVQSAPDQLNTDLREILKRIITPEPTSFLNIPVPEPVTNSIALLVCLVDYDEDNKSDFICTSLVLECFRYTFGVVRNTVMYEEEKRLKIQCQELLSVARNLFSHLGDLGDLLREILMEARKLTNAERCSLFLVDPDHQELVAKVFDSESPKDTLPEVRIARTQGIAGHVATTGMLLNIRDAYSHPLFYKKIDELTGFRTRNILCFPIRDEMQVIGVAELCNKKDGYHFDVFDEEVAMAFSVYCGISIMHSLVYKRIQDAQARNKLSNELMIYHMKVRDSDVQHLLNSVPEHIDRLSDFEFSPRDVAFTLTPAYVYYMFKDLGQLDKFNIKPNIMARFILFVQKGYRDTPYHNWMHAFSTMHFAYMMLKRLELVKRGYFSELQALAYTVACLCHDLDHRGTTNSFQLQSGTILASLYCSDGSVMERHHFSQTLCILNSEGCNIVESLSQENYTMFLDHVLDMILATDLAHHTDVVMPRVELQEDILQECKPKPRYLLSSLMMTLADLSDQTKNWRVVRSTSELVYMEFFRQGDLEKAMGREPAEFMDRERANIPHLQIQFLDNIVFPLLQTITKYFPELEPLLKAAEENRRGWIIAQDLFTARWSQGHFSINILSDPQFEKQVLEELNGHSSPDIVNAEDHITHLILEELTNIECHFGYFQHFLAAHRAEETFLESGC